MGVKVSGKVAAMIWRGRRHGFLTNIWRSNLHQARPMNHLPHALRQSLSAFRPVLILAFLLLGSSISSDAALSHGTSATPLTHLRTSAMEKGSEVSDDETWQKSGSIETLSKARRGLPGDEPNADIASSKESKPLAARSLTLDCVAMLVSTCLLLLGMLVFGTRMLPATVRALTSWTASQTLPME